MKTQSFHLVIGAVLLSASGLWAGAGCSKTPDEQGQKPANVTKLPGHDPLAQDTNPKEGPRMVPPEVYLRSYLKIFGNKTPLEVQADAKTKINNADMALFDTWSDYLALLGLPDYAIDIPRAGQTNTLMMATFERLGIALCDRAIETELKANPALPVAQRNVFAFEVPADAIDQAAFTERFDILHRTFLGYPAALAVTENRTGKYFKLYQDAVAKYTAPDAPATRFTPAEAGWAAVCYGLIRHPEFHLY